MKHLLILSVLWLCSTSNFAQQNWSVATISPALKTQAHAIIRNSETTFTVKNIGEATEKEHLVITILDEQGLAYASKVVFYNKLQKVNNFEGILYDGNGEKVRKLKKDDISDGSAVDNGTLFGDNRYKYAAFRYANFPFTVEFTTETTNKNLLFYPTWFPEQDEEHVSLEQATLTVIMPLTMPLRYKTMNGIGEPTLENTPTGKAYKWTVNNIGIYEHEPYSPSWSNVGKGVLTAPADFEVEGFKGSMKTWNDYGKFANELAKNRDVLPENIKNEVQQLVAPITDPIQKVKKVYEYLQAQTRYISIQLGIGGWQPFDAKEVAEKGYGDCKALSNYTKALLKSIGIESYYTSIKGGSNQREILIDFPSQQFNHAILCVPIKSDTIWLECTSQRNPFGYLSDFTSDRFALLATPEGGKIVRTPAYTALDNQQNRNITVNLSADGNATAQATSHFSGILSDDYTDIKNQLSREEQEKSLYKTILIPSFEISDFSIQEQPKRVPSTIVKVAMKVHKCASRSGTRLFLNPNLMSGVRAIPMNLDKPRQTDIILKTAYTEIDSVQYQLPPNIVIEAKPESMLIESKFGSYQVDYQLKDGKLLYRRKFVRNRGRFAAINYVEFADFYKKVSKADKAQVIFKL